MSMCSPSCNSMTSMGGDVVLCIGIGSDTDGQRKKADDISTRLKLLAKIGVKWRRMAAGALLRRLTVDVEAKSTPRRPRRWWRSWILASAGRSNAIRAAVACRCGCSAVDPRRAGQGAGHDVVSRQIRGDPLALPFTCGCSSPNSSEAGSLQSETLSALSHDAHLPENDRPRIQAASLPSSTRTD